jgi:hypothetical protein
MQIHDILLKAPMSALAQKTRFKPNMFRSRRRGAMQNGQRHCAVTEHAFRDLSFDVPDPAARAPLSIKRKEPAHHAGLSLKAELSCHPPSDDAQQQRTEILS